MVMTYPLVGNYGVPAGACRRARSISPTNRAESKSRAWSFSGTSTSTATTRRPARWTPGSEKTGSRRVHGIDTRTLTRRLREHGTMRGWLVPDGSSLGGSPTAWGRRRHEERGVPGGGSQRADSIRGWRLANPRRRRRASRTTSFGRCSTRGATVTRAPWHADLGWLALEADGIVIGNGPGDPKDLGPLVEQIRRLLGRFEKPIFGICLGNQILTLAAGGDTYKLPYGHRGVNQPVQDLLTRRCYITSQNHGYAVQRFGSSAGLGAMVRQHQRRNQRGRSLARRAHTSACSSIRRRIRGPPTPGSSSTIS